MQPLTEISWRMRVAPGRGAEEEIRLGTAVVRLRQGRAGASTARERGAVLDEAVTRRQGLDRESAVRQIEDIHGDVLEVEFDFHTVFHCISCGCGNWTADK